MLTLKLTRNEALKLIPLIVLLLIPLSQSFYLIRTLIVIFTYAILALSWDLIAGYYRLSILSFAHAALFCLGGYTSGLLAIYYGIPPLVGLLLGGLSAASMGMLLGLICLRFPGRFNIYFIILSIGFSKVMEAIWVNEWRITGGTAGIRVPPFILPESLSIFWGFNYYLVFMILLSLVGLILYIERRPLGYAIRAIYEDDIAAGTLGINVAGTKIVTLTLGGFYAGMAGVSFAHINQVIGPDIGSIVYMLYIFFMAYAGGSGTIVGPILGSFLWYGILESLRVVGVGSLYQKFILTVIFLIIIRLVGWKGVWGIIRPRVKRAFGLV